MATPVEELQVPRLRPMTEDTWAVRHLPQSPPLLSFTLPVVGHRGPKRQENTLNTNHKKFRRPVLAAAAVIAFGLAACGQASGAETVDSSAGAASGSSYLELTPSIGMTPDAYERWAEAEAAESAPPYLELTPSIGMTPDAYERWAAAEVAATYGGMSPDAIEQWRTPNVAVSPNYYPHGYDYSADSNDSVGMSPDAAERWSQSGEPVPSTYNPRGYAYTVGPLEAFSVTSDELVANFGHLTDGD